MAVGTGAAIVGSALIGAMANRDSGSASSSGYQNINLGQASAAETGGGLAAYDVLKQLQQYANLGPGQEAITGAYGAQNDLARMLQQYYQQGFAPSQADFQTAKTQLAPQYEALRQSQQQAQNQFRETAATTGRGPLDFAFQNKLNQNFANQNLMLGAQQSQLASQNSAQRLGFAQDYANLKQGLATQAMQNRLAIAGLGQQIQQTGMNFRLGAAGTSGYQSGQTGSQQGNMLTGAIAGLGTGLSLYNKFGGGGAANGSNNISNSGSGNSGYLGANTQFNFGFNP